MKIIYNILVIASLSFVFIQESYGSDIWKRGFFVDNSGDTIFCLIKDEDWKNNPDHFKWKPALDKDSRIASIEFVSLFMIDSTVLYIRDTVRIETSSSKLDNLSERREPEFKSQVIFLKVLVKGEASLYYYEKGDMQRFFFTNSEIRDPKAMIYKKYRTDEDQIRYNYDFRQQLWRSFDCDVTTLASVNELEYERNDLVRAFEDINVCLNSAYSNYDQFRTRGLLKFSAFLAPNFMETTLSNDFFNIKENYPSSIAWQVGFGIEYYLPFWNNSWSISLATSLMQYGTEGNYILRDTIRTSPFNFLSIDINLAARKYFSFSKENDFFINGGVVVSYPIRSEFTAKYVDTVVPSSRNFFLGLGYKIAKNISAEFRYGFQRDYNYAYFWEVDSSYYGILLGFNLF